MSEICLVRPKSITRECEAGVLGAWTVAAIFYQTGRQCIPRLVGKSTVYAKYDKLLIENCLCQLCFPLVSINYIEVFKRNTFLRKLTARLGLDVRGDTFRLKLYFNPQSTVQDFCDQLRFFVIRQRVPHSLRSLPPDWLQKDRSNNTDYKKPEHFSVSWTGRP